MLVCIILTARCRRLLHIASYLLSTVDPLSIVIRSDVDDEYVPILSVTATLTGHDAYSPVAST